MPVIGTDVAELAAQLARALRVSPTSGAEPDARRAVRRADEGRGPALRRAARDARGERGADAGTPLLRFAAAAAPRARRPASATRDDRLRPRARAGAPRRGRGVRRRLVYRVRTAPRPLLPLRARRAGERHRPPEHVCDRAVARAAHGDPQAARRLDSSRTRDARASSSPRTTTSTTSRKPTSASAIPVALAAKLRRSHFLFLGYGMREWSLRLVLEPDVGRRAARVPLVGGAAEARPLERQFWRTRDVDLLELPLDDYVDALGRYVGLARRRRRERRRAAALSVQGPRARSRTPSSTRCFFFGREREREVIVANLLAVADDRALRDERRRQVVAPRAPGSCASCASSSPTRGRRRCATTWCEARSTARSTAVADADERVPRSSTSSRSTSSTTATTTAATLSRAAGAARTSPRVQRAHLAARGRARAARRVQGAASRTCSRTSCGSSISTGRPRARRSSARSSAGTSSPASRWRSSRSSSTLCSTRSPAVGRASRPHRGAVPPARARADLGRGARRGLRVAAARDAARRSAVPRRSCASICERALDVLDARRAGRRGEHVRPSRDAVGNEGRASRRATSRSTRRVPQETLLPVLATLNRERILRTVDGAGDGRTATRSSTTCSPSRSAPGGSSGGSSASGERRTGGSGSCSSSPSSRRWRWRSSPRSRSSRSFSGAMRVRRRATPARASSRRRRSQISRRDPVRSLQLALSAVRLERSSRVADVLRLALLESHLRRVLPAGGAVTAASFSPDSRRAIVGGATVVRRVRRQDSPAGPGTSRR